MLWKEILIEWRSDLNWTSWSSKPFLSYFKTGSHFSHFAMSWKPGWELHNRLLQKIFALGYFRHWPFLHFENIWILASLKREGSLADFERLEKRTAAAGKWLAFYPSLLNRVLLSLLWCPSFLYLSPLIINIVLSGQVREEFATFCKPWR